MAHTRAEQGGALGEGGEAAPMRPTAVERNFQKCPCEFQETLGQMNWQLLHTVRNPLMYLMNKPIRRQNYHLLEQKSPNKTGNENNVGILILTGNW